MGELVRRLLAEIGSTPRWLILGTGSRTAAKIYADHGFRGLNGGLNQGVQGYNPNDEGEWIMVRDAERMDSSVSLMEGNMRFDEADYVLPGDILVEPLGRRHWGAAVLLLNMLPGAMKLRAFGIDDGLIAELRLAQAIRDCEPVSVAVHA